MTTDRDRRLDEVVTAYLKAREAGHAPDRDQLLAEHPDLADDLAAFLSAESHVHRVIDPPTVGLPEPFGPGVTVEYFGDYHLLEEIGRGGMGVVYKARQESLNRTVALKMILSGQLATDADVRRFRAEAEAAARLDHPGIVPVFEVGQHDGHHYFAMAFVEGQSLARKIVEGLPSPPDAARLVRQIAEAVAYAHVEGVVHRDLKPANILIDKTGQPRLTDFGLAKRVHGEPGALATGEVTATGQILGTPSYMPPEQASGQRDVGPLADVYSLGAILYCLLTGRPPFQADNPLDTLMQVVHRDPVPPRQLNAAVPKDLETVCLKCLEKDPRKRYPSAAELAADLGRFLNGRPIAARPVGSGERAWRWCRRNPAVAGLAAALVLALVTGSVASTVFAVHAKRQAGRATDLAEKATKEADRATASERLTRRYLYSVHMNLAHDAWRRGNVPELLELLARHRPAPGEEDLRGFEWRYLWYQANRQRQSFLLPSHGPHPEAFAVSPDGRWMATGHMELDVLAGRPTLRYIRLWDATTGALHHTFGDARDSTPLAPVRPDEGYEELMFSADSRLLATVAFDYPPGHQEQRNPRIVVWDVGTLGVRATIPLPGFSLGDRIALAFDSRTVGAALTVTPAGGKPTRTLMVWQLPPEAGGRVGEGKVVARREKNTLEQEVPRFAFAHDGKALLWSRAGDTPLTITDVSGTGPERSLPFAGHQLVVSPDGKYLVNHWGNRVTLREAGTGKEVHAVACDTFGCFALSADGRTLAVSVGPVLDLWDVDTKRRVNELRGNVSNVVACGFGAGGRTVITLARPGMAGTREARVWDVLPEPDWLTLGRPADAGYTIAGVGITPDGRTLAAAWASPPGAPPAGTVLLYDLSPGSGGRVLAEARADAPKDFRPERVSLSADGRWLAVSGIGMPADGTLRAAHVHLWALTPGPAGTRVTLKHTYFAPQKFSPFTPVPTFSPDGSRLAYPDNHVGWSYDPKTLDLKAGPHCWQLHDLAGGTTTQLPPDPDAWFPEAGRELREWYRAGPGVGVVFSADGKRVFTGQRGWVIAWDTAAGRAACPLEMPKGLEQVGPSLALSADERLLAAAHEDHSISVWDVSEPALNKLHDDLAEWAKPFIPTGERPRPAPRAVLRGHGERVTAVTFHPDGKVLASASADRTVKVWDLVTGEARLTLEGGTAPVLALAFTPDGNTLISADQAGTVRFWRAAPAEK